MKRKVKTQISVILIISLLILIISTLLGNYFIKKNVQIIADLNNEELQAETEIRSYTPAEVHANASTLYGKEISNYRCDKNEEGIEWKILCADDNNIYLIASNYVSYENLPSASGTTLKPNQGMSEYSAYFNDILDSYNGSSDITNESIQALNNSYFSQSFQSQNKNMKAVAYLSDENAWNGYASDDAKFVVGGPSIELLFKSYNDKYGTNYQAKAISSVGYQISKDGGNSWDTSYEALLDTNDNLYVQKDTNKAYAMWLSSPSGYDTDSVMYVNYNGYIINYNFNYDNIGFRPVVCLNDGIGVKTKEDGTVKVDVSHPVTFIDEKGGRTTTVYVEDELTAEAPDWTIDGYTLSWDTNLDNVITDRTVNAIWTPNEDTAYKVEYYTEVLNSDPKQYELKETVDLTGTTDTEVTAEIKNYDGFTEDASNAERIYTSTIAGNGSTTLKLYYNRNTYTINLVTNNGTINSGNVTNYIYGEEVLLPTDVTRTEAVFLGWYKNEQYTGNPITKIETTDFGDKTFYAGWRLSSYVVTIVDEEGNIIDTQIVNYGEKPQIPNVEGKDGYIPVWKEEVEGITEDTVLTLIWVKSATYRVEYYLETLIKGQYTLRESNTIEGEINTQVTAETKQFEGYVENTQIDKRVPNGTILADSSLVLRLFYDRETEYVIDIDKDINVELEDKYNIALEDETIVKIDKDSTVGEIKEQLGTEGTVTITDKDGNELTDETVIKPGDIIKIETPDGEIHEIVIKEEGTISGVVENTTIGDIKEQLGIEDITKITDKDGNVLTDETVVKPGDIIKIETLDGKVYEFTVSEKGTMSGITENTTIEDIKEQLGTEGTITITDKDGNELTDEDILKTGDIITIETPDGKTQEIVVSVIGDLNGDGKVSITDLSMANQALVEKITLTTAQLKAVDLDNNKKLSITDISMLNRMLVEKI